MSIASGPDELAGRSAARALVWPALARADDDPAAAAGLLAEGGSDVTVVAVLALPPPPDEVTVVVVEGGDTAVSRDSAVPALQFTGPPPTAVQVSPEISRFNTG
jgi:hypothetical protein